MEPNDFMVVSVVKGAKL